MNGIHNVSFLISLNISPCLPIAKPGFSASIITIDLWESNITTETFASSGIIFLIFISAASGSIVKLGSGLSSTLFFILSTISLITPLLFARNSLFFVYKTMFAPSNTESLMIAFLGICLCTSSIIDAIF